MIAKLGEEDRALAADSIETTRLVQYWAEALILLLPSMSGKPAIQQGMEQARSQRARVLRAEYRQ